MTMRVPTVDPCREPPNMTTGLRILRGETATTNEVRIPVAETTNADCMAVALNCPISAPGARLTQMPSLTYNARVQRRAERAARGPSTGTRCWTSPRLLSNDGVVDVP